MTRARLGSLLPPASALRSAGRSRDREPLVTRYLERLRETLLRWGAPGDDVAEILGEIDNHIAEARRAGRSLSTVLGGLGPPDRLAEAYCGALLLDPPGSGVVRWRRPLERPLLFAGSALLLAGLAAAALALAAAGLLGLLAGVVLPYVPPRLLDPTLRAGLPQVVVLVVSALALGLSVQAARWLEVVRRLARVASRRARRGAPHRTEACAAPLRDAAGSEGSEVTERERRPGSSARLRAFPTRPRVERDAP